MFQVFTTAAGALAGLLVGVTAVYALLYFSARRRKTPDWTFDCDELPGGKGILPTLSGLTDSRVYPDSRVEIFRNGAIFDALLEDIAGARHSINLETYVWEAGEVERRFADALLGAARRGVAVRITIDDFGAYRRSNSVFEDLEQQGVQVRVHSPLTLSTLHRFNERTHRKLLIVDGRVGYTMGHGISDNWLGDAQDAEHYRDTGVRITGPAVHGLQSVFVTAWTAETNELLCGDQMFPQLEATADTDVCVVSSASGDAYSNVELAFSLAIAAAKREILIQNPYFAPDPNIVSLLCDAAERGVKVTLMLPGQFTDAYLLRLAARHLYPRLLDAGVTILEYTPTLSHQKIMIVDGEFARIGSTNFDCRSLELNAEAGVALFDRTIAQELRSHFVEDERKCRAITKKNLKKVSLPGRVWMAGIYLLHGQL